MNLKTLYEDLLKTGDLYDMYENMSGDFEQDKNKFKSQQEALESFTSNIEINIDESE